MADAPPGIRITEAHARDVETIMSFDDLTQGTRRRVSAELTGQRPTVRVCHLVAREGDEDDGGDVVAYACAVDLVGDAHVLDIAVAPSHRRRGIGRALLEELILRMRARGCGQVTLEVRTSNTGAQALYRLLGFVVEGRRPSYYPDGEDALLLWLRDGKGPTA